MAWEKKYRWARTWPGETGLDGKPLEDYAGYDGDEYIGRIRLDRESLKKGMWQWSGGRPARFRAKTIQPLSGYVETAAEAAQMVESYWDRMKERRDATDARFSEPPRSSEEFP